MNVSDVSAATRGSPRRMGGWRTATSSNIRHVFERIALWNGNGVRYPLDRPILGGLSTPLALNLKCMMGSEEELLLRGNVELAGNKQRYPP